MCDDYNIINGIPKNQVIESEKQCNFGWPIVNYIVYTFLYQFWFSSALTMQPPHKLLNERPNERNCEMMARHIESTASTESTENVGNDPGAKSHFVWAKFTELKMSFAYGNVRAVAIEPPQMPTQKRTKWSPGSAASSNDERNAIKIRWLAQTI